MAIAASRAGRAAAGAMRGELLARLGEVCLDGDLPEHTRASVAAVASSPERIARILHALGNAIIVEVAEASVGVRPGSPTRPE